MLAIRVSYTLSLQTFSRIFPTFFYLLDFVLPVNARPAPPLTLAPSPFCCPFKRRGLSSLVPPGVERRTPRALRRMAPGSSGRSPLVPGGAGRSLARPPLNLTPVNFRTPQALPSATHACTPVSPHHPHTCPAAMTPAPARERLTWEVWGGWEGAAVSCIEKYTLPVAEGELVTQSISLGVSDDTFSNVTKS